MLFGVFTWFLNEKYSDNARRRSTKFGLPIKDPRVKDSNKVKDNTIFRAAKRVNIMFRTFHLPTFHTSELRLQRLVNSHNNRHPILFFSDPPRIWELINNTWFPRLKGYYRCRRVCFPHVEGKQVRDFHPGCRIHLFNPKQWTLENP